MNRSSALKNFIKKYKHAWVFLYAFVYMPWFMYLEKHITADSEYHVIHSVLDDKIPFVEYFIVPYLLWFVFIAAVFLYFFFTDVEGFYKLAKLSFIGMTIFLLISTVFPNGLTLRPVVFPRIIYLQIWSGCCIWQIPRRMYFRVFMCSILWLHVLQSHRVSS